MPSMSGHPSKSRESIPRGPLLGGFLLLGVLGAGTAQAPEPERSEVADLPAGTPGPVDEEDDTWPTAADMGGEPKPRPQDTAPRDMPPTPKKGWKTPPCSGVQVEAQGACWVLPANPDGTFPRPPCPVGLYAHKGRCFMPVAAGAKRPDASVEE